MEGKAFPLKYKHETAHIYPIYFLHVYITPFIIRVFALYFEVFACERHHFRDFNIFIHALRHILVSINKSKRICSSLSVRSVSELTNVKRDCICNRR